MRNSEFHESAQNVRTSLVFASTIISVIPCMRWIYGAQFQVCLCWETVVQSNEFDIIFSDSDSVESNKNWGISQLDFVHDAIAFDANVIEFVSIDRKAIENFIL